MSQSGQEPGLQTSHGKLVSSQDLDSLVSLVCADLLGKLVV